MNLAFPIANPYPLFYAGREPRRQPVVSIHVRISVYRALS